MKWILYCLCLLLISCSSNNKKSSERKDLLMANFFAADTIPGFVDSQDYHIKMFLAYYNNDTAYLSSQLKEMNLRQDYLSHRIPQLSNDSTLDEAYQIDYIKAFCEDAISISIGVKYSHNEEIQDNVSMTTIVTSKNYEKGNTTKETKKAYKKQLSPDEWNIIREDIHYCDLWGLQSDNYQEGYDGSQLHIFGKQRRARGENVYDKKNIYRWAAEGTALGRLLKDVYKISGVKVNCFYNLQAGNIDFNSIKSSANNCKRKEVCNLG